MREPIRIANALLTQGIQYLSSLYKIMYLSKSSVHNIMFKFFEEIFKKKKLNLKEFQFLKSKYRQGISVYYVRPKVPINVRDECEMLRENNIMRPSYLCWIRQENVLSAVHCNLEFTRWLSSFFRRKVCWDHHINNS